MGPGAGTAAGSSPCTPALPGGGNAEQVWAEPGDAAARLWSVVFTGRGHPCASPEAELDIGGAGPQLAPDEVCDEWMNGSVGGWVGGWVG